MGFFDFMIFVLLLLNLGDWYLSSIVRIWNCEVRFCRYILRCVGLREIEFEDGKFLKCMWNWIVFYIIYLIISCNVFEV